METQMIGPVVKLSTLERAVELPQSVFDSAPWTWGDAKHTLITFADLIIHMEDMGFVDLAGVIHRMYPHSYNLLVDLEN